MRESSAARNTMGWPAFKRVMIQGGGWFFTLTTFTVQFNLSALETVATPLMEKDYGWHSLENSAFFAR